MSQLSKGAKTMAIKARVFNQIRTEFYKKQLKEFTPEAKAAFFDLLFERTREAHWELNFLKGKRRQKAKIQAARVARGYVPKKKTSLEDYQKMLVPVEKK